MSPSDQGREPDRDVMRTSDVMRRRTGGVRGRLRYLWRWLVVDASRWLVVGLLAAFVFLTTLAVGTAGPVSVQQFLLGGTSTADAYIELQPAVVTTITIVLTVNQLILSPELGPVGRQRQRFNQVIDHRTNVENAADVPISPTEPSEFLQLVTRATKEHTAWVEETVADAGDPELRRRVREHTAEITDDAERVEAALADREFGQIEMLGAAMHFDTTSDISGVRGLLDEYSESLSIEQEKAMNDLLGTLEQFTVAREYFRTLYIRSEFIRFSRAVLYTGIPAFLVAHYAVQIIGPNAMTGTTLGVEDLLWFECAALTVTTLPLLVLASFVARLVTLAETSIFIGPFVPDYRGDQ